MTVVRVLTTVPADFEVLRHAPWLQRPGLEPLDRRRLSRWGLLRRLLGGARRHDAILLNGSARDDQIAAALLALVHARVAVVIADATWRRGTSWLDRLARRAVLRLIDGPRVMYCVLSTAELELFPRTWNVDPARVAFTPFCYTWPEAELDRPTSRRGPVFAGGDSMRDYGPLLEAAARRGIPVRLAVKRLPPELRGRPAPTVCAGPASPGAFAALMRDAAAVVVPLQAGIERSAGQQTYLNAMAMGKAVIVTDGPGVRDYVEAGRTARVVPARDAQALGDALAWALDPARSDEVESMGARARADVRARFAPQAHFDSLLAVVAAALA